MLLVEFFFFLGTICLISSYPLQFDYNAPSDIYEKMAQRQHLRGYAKNLLESQKWTDGIVPYTIDAAYSESYIRIISSGMRLIEDSTRIDGKDCIKFVPRTTQTTYLRIFSEDGCWSYIGKVFTGAQELSLKFPTPGDLGSCMFTGTVAHELIHALGFDHEQTRPDRNDYVTINWDKIRSGVESNFQILSNGFDLGFSYDYDSIMHYEGDAFSIDGSPTIVPLKSEVQLINKFNQSYLTETDIGEIRKFYGCNNSLKIKILHGSITTMILFFLLNEYFL